MDVSQRMYDSDIAFTNHSDQASDRNFTEKVREYEAKAVVACIHKHIADHGRWKISASNTQIGHRQGKDEPVCSRL